MHKEDLLYIQSIIHKKNEILPFATTWMDLEGIMLREINQTKKHKYFMMSFIYFIFKKSKYINIIYNIKKNTVIDTENKQEVASGDGLEGRKK